MPFLSILPFFIDSAFYKPKNYSFCSNIVVRNKKKALFKAAT